MKRHYVAYIGDFVLCFGCFCFPGNPPPPAPCAYPFPYPYPYPDGYSISTSIYAIEKFNTILSLGPRPSVRGLNDQKQILNPQRDSRAYTYRFTFALGATRSPPSRSQASTCSI